MQVKRRQKTNKNDDDNEPIQSKKQSKYCSCVDNTRGNKGSAKDTEQNAQRKQRGC